MNYIFILNPCAGNGKKTEEIRQKIQSLHGNITVLETPAPRTASRMVRDFCDAHPDEENRFFACGGDGTIHEVALGLLGRSNASLACVPVGSGNDFVKYFGGAERFLDLEALMEAPTVPVDMMQICTEEGDEVYSINVANFGFDAFVAATMNKVRRMPLLGGNNAYTTGIVAALFRAMNNRAKIYADGELLFENGKFLLCTLSNASHVGGSFCCAPRANVADGKIEVCAVKPISVFRFLRLVGAYQEGTHLDDARFTDLLEYRRAESVEVVFPEKTALCLDGEMTETSRFTAKMLPDAIQVAVPAAHVKCEKAKNTCSF